MKWLALAALILAPACAFTSPAPDPGRILEAIRLKGPRPVVRQLWESGAYDTVLDEIASGDSAWIALAPELAKGADAAAAEALGISLARALPRNAASVLSVLDDTNPAISTGRVCRMPFVEGSLGDPAAYRRDAEAAVIQVEGGSLTRSKKACLADLRNLQGNRIWNSVPLNPGLARRGGDRFYLGALQPRCVRPPWISLLPVGQAWMTREQGMPVGMTSMSF
jgi:hypothetical protein